MNKFQQLSRRKFHRWEYVAMAITVAVLLACIAYYLYGLNQAFKAF